MDAARREITDGAVFAREGVIEVVGSSSDLPTTADEVIDCSDQVVLPGLVNTHHHMFQSLTRAVPAAQDCELFDWLRTLYPMWARLTPEMIAVSTKVAMAELLLSGCTTSSDHLYVFPNGCRLDDSIEAAAEVGMRFHASRGSMSVGLHTHLAENSNDIAYSREKFNCTPVEYAEQLGWLGRDVWCAHCVQLDAAGIAAFGRSGTGVAHCPCSNMRLGSGIAPIRAMLAAGGRRPSRNRCRRQVPRVTLNVVQGKALVLGGELTSIELPTLIARHNRLAASIAYA